MNYQSMITKIIENSINLTESIENIKEDTNLQNVGMDSISFVRVIVEIENQFQIEFPDEKLFITQSGTIKQLCKIIMEAKGETDGT